MLLPLLVKSCLACLLWGDEVLVCCCPCSSTSACLAQLQTLPPPWQFSHSRPTSQGSLVRWNRQDGSSVNVMMERFCVAGSFLPLQSEGLEFWSANYLEVPFDHISIINLFNVIVQSANHLEVLYDHIFVPAWLWICLFFNLFDFPLPSPLISNISWF